jgi:hypothetical protein
VAAGVFIMAIRQCFPVFTAVLASGFATLVLSGCISLSIGQKGAQKSEDVRFDEPGSSFQALGNTPADKAWQNKDNGNTISYLSSCNDPADPTLASAAQEMTVDLQNPNTIKSEYVRSNGREALDTDTEGRIEGVTTRVRTFIFKKNGCLYTLSYVGISKTFEKNKADFEKFVKGFVAP